MTHIDKPWGYEEVLEQNDHYMLKKLMMKQGKRCSLQYHEQKRETIYLLSGTLNIYHGTSADDLACERLSPHHVLTLAPSVVHRMEALEDSIYLEASTPQTDDVIRLEDDYQRVTQ